jgi:hypothetical protein
MAVAAVALAVGVVGVTAGIAAPSRAPDPKQQAESDVLGFLQEARGHRWVLRHPGGRRLFPRLYNPHTQLLRNNTSVRCVRAQNRQHRGRFFCVVRPGLHRRHEGLHVRYIRFAEGYFRIKWLYYRPG